MLRISLSAIVVIFTLTAVFAFELIATNQFKTVYTESQYNVAIAGNGYFCVTDESSGDTRFTRAGQLAINPDGCVVIRVEQTELRIDPQLFAPESAKDIRIDTTGRFYVLLGSEWQYCGQIQLCLLHDPVNRGDRLSFTKYSGRYFRDLPGNCGIGRILQGSLEHPKYAPPRAETAFVLFATLVAWFNNRRIIGNASRSCIRLS
ncbi:MAG: hypothetical protein U0930_00780 [Pirellulales bacterium]